MPSEPAGFVCSTCGRTDLPEAGDWDPPICLECDAAINFDAELALEASAVGRRPRRGRLKARHRLRRAGCPPRLHAGRPDSA